MASAIPIQEHVTKNRLQRSAYHTVNNLKRAPGVVVEERLQQNVALGGENIAAMAANIHHFPLSSQHDQNPLCLSSVSGSLTVQQKLA